MTNDMAADGAVPPSRKRGRPPFSTEAVWHEVELLYRTRLGFAMVNQSALAKHLSVNRRTVSSKIADLERQRRALRWHRHGKSGMAVLIAQNGELKVPRDWRGPLPWDL